MHEKQNNNNKKTIWTIAGKGQGPRDVGVVCIKGVLCVNLRVSSCVKGSFINTVLHVWAGRTDLPGEG